MGAPHLEVDEGKSGDEDDEGNRRCELAGREYGFEEILESLSAHQPSSTTNAAWSKSVASGYGEAEYR